MREVRLSCAMTIEPLSCIFAASTSSAVGPSASSESSSSRRSSSDWRVFSGENAEIDTDRAAVAQEVERGRHEVRKPGVLADPLEEPRAHARAEQRLRHAQRVAAGSDDASPRVPSDR